MGRGSFVVTIRTGIKLSVKERKEERELFPPWKIHRDNKLQMLHLSWLPLKLQGSAKRVGSVCVNAVGKARQKQWARAGTKFTKPWDRLLVTLCKLYMYLHTSPKRVLYVEAYCPLHYFRIIWWKVSRPRKRKNTCLFSIFEPTVNIVTDVWSESILSIENFMRHLPNFGRTNIRPAERSHLNRSMLWVIPGQHKPAKKWKKKTKISR